jgi:tRNA G10  N-methylase Trm11
MLYFLILGKNPILSKAEIEAVLALKGFKYKAIKFYAQVLILETEKEIDVEWLNQRLGGTVKIGKILGSVNNLENFEHKFFDWIEFGNGKVFFGFSLYSLEAAVHVQKYQRTLNPVAMEIKRKLREEKQINSRYVVSREIELSSVIVAKNKLLKNGAEICFFVAAQEILVGQTLAVQPFEEFGERDFGRPSRDSVSGMLPPKLAKIMINLAQANEDKIMLDPFCGSGTILQEALLMGYQKIIGFDNSDKAIKDSKNNLDWLIKKLNLQVQGLEVKNLDVRNLSQQIGANTVGVIVTEPYLGPAQKGNESPKQIEAIIKDLEKLYLEAFLQFYKVLTKGGRVVCVFPIFKKDSLKLNILSDIRKMGYKLLNQDDLIYYRQQQLVWRDILIFEK